MVSLKFASVIRLLIQEFKIGNRILAGPNSLRNMFLIRAPEGITEKGGASGVTFQLFFWTIV